MSHKRSARTRLMELFGIILCAVPTLVVFVVLAQQPAVEIAAAPLVTPVMVRLTAAQQLVTASPSPTRTKPAATRTQAPTDTPTLAASATPSPSATRRASIIAPTETTTPTETATTVATAASVPSGPPCVLDWGLGVSVENYNTLLACYKTLYGAPPPKGAPPFCPPSITSPWWVETDIFRGSCWLVLAPTPTPTATATESPTPADGTITPGAYP